MVDTSIPGVLRNNSIVENKVKLVINGARSLLLQAGLPSRFWPFAVQAFCNGLTTMIVGDRSRSCKRRGVEFHGALIPFGCLVDYFPTKRTYSADDLNVYTRFENNPVYEICGEKVKTDSS